MAWRALPILAEAEQVLGAPSGYTQTGYVVGVGTENIGALRANVAMQQRLGIDVELIGHEDAQAMLPAARLDDFAAFAYEPRGGYGDGHQTAMAFAAAARQGGAHLRQHCTVSAIELTNERVRGVLLVDGRRIGAAHVVVAAGPWSPALVAPLGIDLPVRAQRAQVLLVDPGQPLGPLPVFSDLVSLQYVRMEGVGTLLLCDSDHSRPEWTDPDDYRERAGEDELMFAVPKFTRRFPGFEDAALASSYAGCYDVTPDYNPVISSSPVEGLWLCAGFSGHGYKISPAVGEPMADVITKGESRHRDINQRDFRWSRFAEEDPLVSPPHPTRRHLALFPPCQQLPQASKPGFLLLNLWHVKSSIHHSHLGRCMRRRTGHLDGPRCPDRRLRRFAAPYLTLDPSVDYQRMP